MAIEHKNITNADLHEPKDVSSAVTGTVYVADGAGSGDWTPQASIPSTIIGVESISDFPTAVSSVITLAANTRYQINKAIDVGDARFVFSSGSEIVGVSASLSSITTTTVSAVFTGTSVRMYVRGLTVDAPSASELFKFDGGGTHGLELRNIIATTLTAVFCECSSAVRSEFDNLTISGGTNIFKFLGTHGSAIFSRVGCVGFTGTCVDLGTAVFSGILMTTLGIVGTGAGDIGLSGAAGNANITAEGVAAVTDVNFLGTTTVLSGITQNDTKFAFQGNKGIKDTRPHGQVFINGNATTTSIASTDTPVVMDGGTGFAAASEEHFTASTAGRLTYDGLEDLSVLVLASISGTGSSSTHTFKLYVAKNGVVIAESGVAQEYTSTASASISLISMVDIVQDDYLEVWIENKTGTVDFEMVDCSIVVKV